MKTFLSGRKKVFVCVAAIVLLIAVAAVLLLLPKVGAQVPPGTPATQVTSAPQSTKVEAEPGEMTLSIFSCYLGTTMEEVMARSTLAVTGTVEEILPARRIATASHTGDTVTDVRLRINEVLRGEADEVITVRLSGGRFAGQLEVYEDEPILTTGKEYLFFLFQPHMGGQYAQGDFYYIVRTSEGAYERIEATELEQEARAQLAQGDKVFASCESVEQGEKFLRNLASEKIKFTSIFSVEQIEAPTGRLPSDTVFSLDTLREGLVVFNQKNPIDTGLYRREAEEGLKKSLESQGITQEEYDQEMAELDIYATYMTEDEVYAREPKEKKVT